MEKECSEPGRHSIRHDAFDQMIYEEVFHQSATLQNLAVQGSKGLRTFGELASDVFFALYKANLEVVKQAEMLPEYSLNHEHMAKLLESPVYQELRQYTKLDELGAGLGSKALLEALLQQLQEDTHLKEAAEKANEAVERQAAAQTFEQNTADFEKAVAEAHDATDKARQIISGIQATLRQAIDQAAHTAAQEVEEADSVICSWGLNKGEFTRLPYARKVELLQVLRGQRKFRGMTKLVGRMRNIALASRKSKLSQRVELHSITQGNDISHVLPQEFLAFRQPTLKPDFYRRLLEKQLLQYDLNQTEAVGQGPIIALVDTSGSMRNGGREVWSKAVALGLAEIAEKEHRAFCYALFASRRDELVTDEFIPGQRSPDKMLKLAIEFLGGGTDYEQPLTWALDKLKESKFNKADVVLISDGECRLNDQFQTELQKVRQEKEFRIYSILIGDCQQELKRWSDEVWSITDLLDDSTVTELFEKI